MSYISTKLNSLSSSVSMYSSVLLVTCVVGGNGIQLASLEILEISVAYEFEELK